MVAEKVNAENVKEVKKLDKGNYEIVYLDGSSESRKMDKAEHFGLITKMRHLKNKQINSASKAESADRHPRSEYAESQYDSGHTESTYSDQQYSDYVQGKLPGLKSFSPLDAVELNDPANFVAVLPTDADIPRVRFMGGIPGCGKHLTPNSRNRILSYGNPGESVRMDEVVKINEHTLYIIPKPLYDLQKARERAQAINILEDGLVPEFIKRGGMQLNHPASGRTKITKSIG